MDPQAQSTNSELSRSMVVTYLCFSLAICTTFARLYARGYVLRQFGLDDFLIVVAIAIGISTISLHQRMVDHVYEIVRLVHVKKVSDFAPAVLGAVSEAMKNTYMASLLYGVEISTIKISILVFYTRFLPPSTTRTMAQATAVIIFLFTFATTVATIFQCKPLSAAWGPVRTPKICPVNDSQLKLSINIFSLLTDIIVLLLPIPCLLKLQMSTKKKFGLIFLFSLGIIGTVATALRLWKAVGMARMIRPDSWSSLLIILADMLMWSEIERNMGILCANLPAISALFRGFTRRTRQARTSKEVYRPQDYELHMRSDQERGLTTSTAGPRLSTSGEHIMALKNDIVRSTEVSISVEDATNRSV